MGDNWAKLTRSQFDAYFNCQEQVFRYQSGHKSKQDRYLSKAELNKQSNTTTSNIILLGYIHEFWGESVCKLSLTRNWRFNLISQSGWNALTSA